jgi:hypothetical protein
MPGKRCRGFLFAILVYVTLDLSLAAMPGAFVFDLADSAESTQIRARAATESVVLSAVARDPGWALFQLPLERKELLALSRSAERHGNTVVSWRVPARYDSPPPSKDPH